MRCYIVIGYVTVSGYRTRMISLMWMWNIYSVRSLIIRLTTLSFEWRMTIFCIRIFWIHWIARKMWNGKLLGFVSIIFIICTEKSLSPMTLSHIDVHICWIMSMHNFDSAVVFNNARWSHLTGLSNNNNNKKHVSIVYHQNNRLFIWSPHSEIHNKNKNHSKHKNKLWTICIRICIICGDSRYMTSRIELKLGSIANKSFYIRYKYRMPTKSKRPCDKNCVWRTRKATASFVRVNLIATHHFIHIVHAQSAIISFTDKICIISWE